MESIRNRALRGIRWSTLQQGVNHAISVTVFVVLARILQPEDFGLVAFSSVVIGFVGPFVTQGLGAAIVQRENLEELHLDAAFWFNMTVGTLLSALLALCAPAIASTMGQPDAGPVIAWLAVGLFILSLSSVQGAILRRNLAFRALATRSLVAAVVAGSAAVILALSGFGVWSLVARQLIESIISVVLLWSVSGWRPRLRFSRTHFQDLFRFGFNVVATDLLVFVNRRADNLFIGFFLGPAALGYYAVAYRLLTMALRFLSQTVYRVAMPVVARLQSEPQRVARSFCRITHATAHVSLPIFAGLGLLASDLVPALFGPKWSPSIPVMQLLAGVGALQTLLRPIVAVIVGMGRPEWRLRLQFVDGVMNLAGFAVAVHWGFVAVAFSYLVVNYALAPLWFILLARMIPISPRQYFAQIQAPLFGAAAMCAIVLLVQYALPLTLPSWQRLGLCTTAGVLSYSAAVRIVFPRDAREFIEIARRVLSSPPKATSRSS
jgi:O-antigen/teichoic acid export membrane protein